MGKKLFFWLTAFGTVISAIGLGVIIANFDPGQIGFFSFFLFYLSFFLAVSGFIFIISEWLKERFLKNQNLYYRLATSTRHSIFFGLLLTGWLFMKSQKLLTWWGLLLFILILTILEFFFLSLKKSKNIS
ncbi:MAG TPA: hypothetical protein VJG65_03650 [Patescibacteria group bacterium]|nr:hypothetical protein [Patescibacteria group bacterium]